MKADTNIIKMIVTYNIKFYFFFLAQAEEIYVNNFVIW